MQLMSLSCGFPLHRYTYYNWAGPDSAETRSVQKSNVKPFNQTPDKELAGCWFTDRFTYWKKWKYYDYYTTNSQLQKSSFHSKPV